MLAAGGYELTAKRRLGGGQMRPSRSRGNVALLTGAECQCPGLRSNT